MVDATLSRQLYIALDWRIVLVMSIQLLGEREGALACIARFTHSWLQLPPAAAVVTAAWPKARPRQVAKTKRVLACMAADGLLGELVSFWGFVWLIAVD
jgi:hypothetical protein